MGFCCVNLCTFVHLADLGFCKEDHHNYRFVVSLVEASVLVSSAVACVKKM